jgi:hypothetical protein
MSKEKMALFVATTTFIRNVTQSIAVGGSQRRSARNNIEREGNNLLSKVTINNYSIFDKEKQTLLGLILQTFFCE